MTERTDNVCCRPSKTLLVALFCVLAGVLFLTAIPTAWATPVQQGPDPGPYPAITIPPMITTLSPNSAAKGGPSFTLTIIGMAFLNGATAQWNGADRTTTFVSSTKVTAAVDAADIADTGVAYVTVVNPAPDGGTSNPQPFFINTTGAKVVSSDTASGTNPSASTGGATGVTANATGTGAVTVGIYDSNPGGTPSFASTGRFMDVHLAPGHSFTSLTIVDCDLNGGTHVYWWNGTAWALASNQSYNPATQCVTITVDNSTSPSLSDLTGTPFGAAGVPVTAVTITGPTQGVPGVPYAFTAVVSPTEALPTVSYFWLPEPVSGQSTANASYMWTTPGSKKITVVALDPQDPQHGGVASDEHNIFIFTSLTYMPMIHNYPLPLMR